MQTKATQAVASFMKLELLYYKTSFFPLRKEAKKLYLQKKTMPHYPPNRNQRFNTGFIIMLVAMFIFAIIKGIEYLICLYL